MVKWHCFKVIDNIAIIGCSFRAQQRGEDHTENFELQGLKLTASGHKTNMKVQSVKPPRWKRELPEEAWLLFPPPMV